MSDLKESERMYFKRPNGDVFHKTKAYGKANKKEYADAGITVCDKSGKPLKAGRPKKTK